MWKIQLYLQLTGNQNGKPEKIKIAGPKQEWERWNDKIKFLWDLCQLICDWKKYEVLQDATVKNQMSGSPDCRGNCASKYDPGVWLSLIFRSLLKVSVKVLIKSTFPCKEPQFKNEKHFITQTKHIIWEEQKWFKDHRFKLFWEKKESCCKYFGVFSGKGTGKKGLSLSDTSISNYSRPTSEHICGIKYATVTRKNIETELEWRTKLRAPDRTDVF